MNKINYYEVLDQRERFMGIYSTKFDSEISLGISALGMAQINARQSGGKVYSVNFDEERELVWPK